MKTESKLRKLEVILRRLGKAAVAFSGGTDSAFLSAAALRALGSGALAVTAVSGTLTGAEKKDTTSGN